MRTMYPPIKMYDCQFMQLDSIHEVYIEQCGSPSGIPVLFVHGGPGAGCTDKDRCFFDPEKYRIILFDQRGCGRSKPHAEIADNTPQQLISDMELIREYLEVDEWVIFGGSWGATLSLLYAQAYADKVLGLVLSGIFLTRKQDIAWIYQDGACRIFPDQWQNFLDPIPENERTNLLESYHSRLFGEDELARMNAAKHWSLWEANISTLRPNQELVDQFTEPHQALSLSRIECHYFRNGCFLKNNQIIENMASITGIPGVIIHGRYDMLCPLDNALALADLWPGVDFQIIRDAGHASCEPSMVDALVRATDRFANNLAVG